MLLTVIIPTYNIERYLRTCLDSVVNQTYKNLEIIILDDNSSDNTPEIIREYAAKDRRIKAVFHTENAGPGPTRNEGLSLATGDYITLMDHDDWQDLDKYEKMMSKAIKYDLDIVFCNAQEYEEESQTINRAYFPWPKPALRPGVVLYNNSPEAISQMSWGLGTPWGKIIRKELVEKHQIRFSEGGNRFDDHLFHFHGCYFAKSAYYIDEILYTHRFFAHSISGQAQQKGDMFFDLFKTWQDLEDVCKKSGILPKEMLILYFRVFVSFMRHVHSKRAYIRQANAILTQYNVELEDIPPHLVRLYKRLKRSNTLLGYWLYLVKLRLQPYYRATKKCILKLNKRLQ